MPVVTDLTLAQEGGVGMFVWGEGGKRGRGLGGGMGCVRGDSGRYVLGEQETIIGLGQLSTSAIVLHTLTGTQLETGQ